MKRLMFAAGKEKHLKADRLFVNILRWARLPDPTKCFHEALFPRRVRAILAL